RVRTCLLLSRKFGTECASSLENVRKTKHKRAWWLEEDAEVCPACVQTYAFQTEYRCTGCDGVVCAMCATQTTEIEIFCPPCAGSPVESEVRRWQLGQFGEAIYKCAQRKWRVSCIPTATTR